MGTGMSWWDDLFGRRRARPGSEYTFLEIYLRKTQERFESAWKEIEESHISRVRKGEEDHNWDDHKAVADFRLELIKAGWLPPREKDALARTGKKAGLWLARINPANGHTIGDTRWRSCPTKCGATTRIILTTTTHTADERCLPTP